MFPMTITLHNAAQLNAVLKSMASVESLGVMVPAGSAEAPAADIQAVVTKAEEKAAKKPKTTSAATTADAAPGQPTAEVGAATDAPVKTADASPPTAGSAEAAPQASTAATDAPAVTYKDAAEVVTKLSRTKGRDAAIAVLKSFGAEKLPDVKPEDFAAVVAACQAALEG